MGSIAGVYELDYWRISKVFNYVYLNLSFFLDVYEFDSKFDKFKIMKDYKFL